MNCYYAHTKNQYEKNHFLKDHLVSVANLTKQFTKNFYNGQFMPLAWLVGLLHDLGKINPQFQDYLKALDEGMKPSKVSHAPWGAYFVYLAFSKWEIKKDLALSIAGHHAGLDEIGAMTAKLMALTPDQGFKSEIMRVAQLLIKENTFSNFKSPSLTALQRELLVRMFFSALIDADRLDTEAHFSPEKSRLRGNTVTLKELANKLRSKQAQLIAEKQSDPTPVNQIRKIVYDACMAEALAKPGLYRLTVPTGGGKTRSALAFALEHALANGQQRVIFALPYTSIIDQTAKVYKDIFGANAVLEHHSQVTIKDEEDESKEILSLRLAEENWDVPIVVTTTVQLLESLFSNNPTRCRKIHRLARSVIVFDEAQTLPAELLKPTLQVLRDLIENYGTTVVLSTATQPALKSDYLPEMNAIDIREIVPDYAHHFEQLKRVRYERLPAAVSIEALAGEISKHEQVLVIMNTRKKALKLVEALEEKDCLHLSTLLCGAHRKKVLAKVEKLLKDGKPVRLISTQVVEAGVDLDFPVVYRAVGPLDRIVQAAGRCNREGKMELGMVVIFELEDEKSPRGIYKAGMEQAKLILSEHDSPDVLNNPSIFEEYFLRLFNSLGNNLDIYEIQDKRAKLDYPETSALYRLIKDETIPVVVKYKGYKLALDRWQNNPCRETWRRLQPYLVNIYEREARDFFRNGLMSEISKGLYLWEGIYDKLKGLSGVQWDPADLIV
ncbi:MAG: CRISPR-associated helicase Cas3' [Peptococcaceae bacterium]|nr:CRISPR-associated helicase Cas3' [Peptococcaceae bacterium]